MQEGLVVVLAQLMHTDLEKLPLGQVQQQQYQEALLCAAVPAETIVAPVLLAVLC